MNEAEKSEWVRRINAREYSVENITMKGQPEEGTGGCWYQDFKVLGVKWPSRVFLCNENELMPKLRGKKLRCLDEIGMTYDEHGDLLEWC